MNKDETYEKDAELLRSYYEILVTELAGSNADVTVEVTAVTSGGICILSAYVPHEHMGKCVGHGGKIIKALKTILISMGCKYSLDVQVELVRRDA